jgi:hypothetical protein
MSFLRAQARAAGDRERPLGGGQQLVLRHDAGGAGVLEDVRRLLAGEHEVDRDEDRPQLGRGEGDHDEGVPGGPEWGVVCVSRRRA